MKLIIYNYFFFSVSLGMAVSVDEFEVLSRRRTRLVFIETGEDLQNADTNTENNRPPSILSWKSIIWRIFYNNKTYSPNVISLIVFTIVLYRLLTAFIVHSFFDPDEYWQSMEVAHKISFGYGHLTWEWEQQIRSYIHPLIFSLLYSFLKITGLDSPWMVQWLPRLFQALILSLQDFGVYLLSLRLFPSVNGKKIAFVALLFEMALWFNGYCGVRTYSNCMETCSIIIGLLFWPFPDRTILSFRPFSVKVLSLRPVCTDRHTIIALFFAGLSVAIRPTAAIFWIIMTISLLTSVSSKYLSKIRFLCITICMGIFWILILIGIDWIMYGEFVFVPWNFVKFNVLRGVGSYYGTHPFHWYITNALPVVLFTTLPVFIYGCYKIFRAQFQLKDSNPELIEPNFAGELMYACFSYITIFSVLGHKEFRFLYPLVPLMMIICGYGSFSFITSKKFLSPSLKRLIILGLLFANIPMFLYFSQYHQVGNISALEHIQNDEDVSSVYFLIPCHQSPLYSFVHRNITLKFPDCSPPVGKNSSLIGYRTENSEFLKDPLSFVETMFDTNDNIMKESIPEWVKESNLPLEKPSHFVVYEKIANELYPFFQKHKYSECERFFHSYTPLDDIQSDVLIFCQKI